MDINNSQSIVFGSGDQEYSVTCGDITTTHYTLLEKIKSNKSLFEATVLEINEYLPTHFRKLLAYSIWNFYQKLILTYPKVVPLRKFCILEPHIRTAELLELISVDHPDATFSPRFVAPSAKPIVKQATVGNVFSLKNKFIELETWYTNLARTISELTVKGVLRSETP